MFEETHGFWHDLFFNAGLGSVVAWVVAVIYGLGLLVVACEVTWHATMWTAEYIKSRGVQRMADDLWCVGVNVMILTLIVVAVYLLNRAGLLPAFSDD